MDMIKKAILELWCMAYGFMLFLIAWWVVVSAAALVATALIVIHLVSRMKSRRQTLDES